MTGLVRGATFVSGVGRLAAIAFLAVGVYGTIPDGYIMQVRTSCGNDHVTDASISVVTDLPEAMVTADCPVGELDFNTDDEVNFMLPVSYPGQGSSPCVFKKRQDSETYAMLIYISYGDTGGRVQQGEEYYTVSCTFDPKGIDDSSQQTIDETLVAPVELQINKGTDTSSSLTLTLVDILGDEVDPSVAVRTDRKFSLKLTTDGTSGELGVRPVSCVALGATTGSYYSVLRAGCGDGIIFPRHSGFETTNLEAISPYFDSFGINDGPTVSFECNVTLCDTSCDGNSCVTGRRKRNGARRSIQTVIITSPTFRSFKSR